MCEITVQVTCPHCHSTNIVKNGHKKDNVQNYLCKSCKKQFIFNYQYQSISYHRISSHDYRTTQHLCLLPIVRNQILSKFKHKLNMKKTIFYLLFSLFSYCGYAQETIESLSQEATKAYEKGDVPAVIIIFEKVILLMEKDYGETHPDYVPLVDALALLYIKQGKYAEAEKSYLQVLAIRKKVFGDKHIKYAIALRNLTDLYYSQGKYFQAERFYKELTDISKEILGENHADYASALNTLAFLYINIGKYADAEKSYLEVLAIRKKLFGNKHEEYAATLNNLASLYESQGKYAQSEKLYKQSTAICKEVLGENHPKYASSLNSLGYLYFKEGYYAKAETFYRQAMAIRKKVSGEKNAEYASSLNNLALLYDEQGNYAQAEILYIQALAIVKETLGENHPNYASSLNNLAGNYDKQRKYAEAETLYLQSLNIHKVALEGRHHEYANTINNLALHYTNTGKNKEATVLYTQALALCKQILGEKHPNYATSLSNLSLVYRSQKQYQKATDLLVEAMAISKEILGEKHPDYTMSLNNLAYLYAEQGKLAEAAPLYVQALQKKLNELQTNFLGLSEREKQQYFNINRIFFDNFYYFISQISSNKTSKNVENLLPNLLQNLLNTQLQTKAIILGETQKMKKRILASKDTALIAQFENWHNLKNNIAKVHNLSISEREKQGIDMVKLENEANIAEKQLATQSADFAKAFTPKNYDYKDLQKKLKTDEVALEIIKVAGDSSYLVLFVTKKDLEVMKLGNAYELESKFLKQYRNNISYKIADKTSYNNFWKPFLPFIKDAKKVYFCPDEVYNQISLNTLQNTETNKFLGEEIDITIVGNLKDIFEESSNNSNKTAELFGRPDYKKGNNKDKNNDENNEKNEKNKDRGLNNDRNFASFSSIKKSSFADLAGTEIEVKGIASNLTQQNYKVGLFLGADAVEEQVKSTNSPKILHISTHGYFVLSDSKNKINGMLSSGIVLAGVNDLSIDTENSDTEDGVLTAYEASTLNLDNTDLVVLSACETGLGEVATGEGVYGLQRGFKVAGADAVLMSLWKVDDKATQELMNLFYTNWLKTGNKRQALLQAQAELREKYKSPYYWGAFVLVGE